MRSELDEVKMACDLIGIGVSAGFPGVLLLTCLGVQVIIDFKSSNAIWTLALPKRMKIFRVSFY